MRLQLHKKCFDIVMARRIRVRKQTTINWISRCCVKCIDWKKRSNNANSYRLFEILFNGPSLMEAVETVSYSICPEVNGHTC